jgi:probable phosphoglycerate mutase
MTVRSGAPPDRRLIVVRHGATAWNAEGRYTTRTDMPLSPAGLEQARATAAALAGEPIDRVFCSPLSRARTTGELIAAALPQPVEVLVDERLTEIDAGPFEGLTTAQINAGPLAEAHARWHADTADPATPAGAEPLDSARDRAAAFFADASALPGTTLAATHGSFARVLVAAVVLGADPAAHRRLWLGNGHWAVIEFDDRPRLVAWNAGARTDTAS